jgi:hypothetical protein
MHSSSNFLIWNLRGIDYWIIGDVLVYKVWKLSAGSDDMIAFETSSLDFRLVHILHYFWDILKPWLTV